MTDIRQAPDYTQFLHSLGWKTELNSKKSYSAAVRTLLPLFGILKLQRVPLDDIDFAWLKQLAKKHWIFASYVELADRHTVPTRQTFNAQELVAFADQFSHQLKKHGYSPITQGMLPSKTQIIDVTQSMDAIMSGMKPKTRYNISLANRKNISVRKVSTQEFLSNPTLVHDVTTLLQKNAKRSGYWVEGKSWVQKKMTAFGKHAFVLTAHPPSNANELLAVALFLYSDDTLFYWVNGSTQTGRKLFAPSLLIHQALLEAKDRNLQAFDFDGVFDERFPNKRWLGYTRFKQGFGGNYVFYPPCYIKRFALVR